MSGNSETTDFNELSDNLITHAVTGKPLVIPVIEERVKVDKKIIESGKVRVSKKVTEEAKEIDVQVMQEEVKVERIPVHQIVDTIPQVRYEGETMIVPVVREVVVVEKRIELVEELHITKHRYQTEVSQQVTLRKEEVTVERLSPENTNPQPDL